MELHQLFAWLAAIVAYSMAWLGLRRASNTDNHQPLAPVEKLKGYFDLAKVSSITCSSDAGSATQLMGCEQVGCSVNCLLYLQHALQDSSRLHACIRKAIGFATKPQCISHMQPVL